MEVTIYENDEEKNPHRNPSGPWTQSRIRIEAQNRSRNRCFVLITVLLGLICVLLVVGILVLYIHLTVERNLMKMSNTEGYNKTLNSLKMNYSQLTNEKEELKKTLNSINQKKLELETKVNNLNDALMKKSSLYSQLNDEKEELKKTLNSINQKRLELETKVNNLNDALMKKSGSYMYFISSENKNWADSRQFCRDRGQDLAIINTEEEQRYISSIAKEDMWIGLTDIAEEGKMKWVDNRILDKGFWSQGEPNDQNGLEDCVVILRFAQSPLNSWNDIPCSLTRKWICENL